MILLQKNNIQVGKIIVFSTYIYCISLDGMSAGLEYHYYHLLYLLFVLTILAWKKKICSKYSLSYF